ncbi:GNAT family N-acetyltransferase [Catenuloplanes atrovinosus]|uniref:GNAT superfamily N-acetyltransferase n=1 Tax=Catenuloplanes atrovinosus TaxID=137266 RepID=A0AAE3YSC1_9ACTN|nr:GNAT family N-acetyltransferase [Catenuloplanes atrovinosus]MDR7277464.1 GNAT superfamily N-acetyltransferase [Catenuloplanes atrovinosus]
MIRTYEPRDLDVAVGLLDLGSSSDTRVRWRRLLRSGDDVRAVVAERAGRVVGAAMAAAVPDYRGQRPVRIGVEECARGRGIGTALAVELARIDRDVAEPLALTLRDDRPDGRRFAERLGFRVVNHCTGWTVALDDAGALRVAADAAAVRAGVRLEATTVGEARERFVAAAADSLAGMPSDTPIDLVEFAAHMPADVVVLFAEDHEGTAGVCLIRRDVGTGGWHTSYTGVATRARRRGVARAVKLGSFAAAAERGGTAMHAENDDRNAPMLALSESLGMRRDLGYWTMEAVRLAPGDPAR